MLPLLMVRPDDIKGFVARNGGTVDSNSAKEVWMTYLAASGGTGTRLPELEATWLASLGAIGNNERDLWGSYLNQNGYVGNFQDQMRVFFTSGSAGAGSPGSDRLLESGSFRLLESSATDTRLLEA